MTEYDRSHASPDHGQHARSPLIPHRDGRVPSRRPGRTTAARRTCPADHAVVGQRGRIPGTYIDPPPAHRPSEGDRRPHRLRHPALGTTAVGHATAMLAAALPVARSLGIDPALLTCDDDNIASRKVIEANPAACGLVSQGDRSQRRDAGRPPPRQGPLLGIHLLTAHCATRAASAGPRRPAERAR